MLHLDPHSTLIVRNLFSSTGKGFQDKGPIIF